MNATSRSEYLRRGTCDTRIGITAQKWQTVAGRILGISAAHGPTKEKELTLGYVARQNEAATSTRNILDVYGAHVLCIRKAWRRVMQRA